MTTESVPTPDTPSVADSVIEQEPPLRLVEPVAGPRTGLPSGVRLLVLAVAAALIGGAIYVLSTPSSGSTVMEFPQPAAGSSAVALGSSGSALPALEVKTLDGRVINLAELKGKQVVINFWATWCPPCRDELPDLARTYEEKKGQGLEVIAVDVQEGGPVVERYLREIGGLPFTVGLDEDGAISRGFNVVSLPTSLFVDDEGVVRIRYVGGMNYSTIQRKLLQTSEEQEYAKQQEANKS